MTSNGMSSNGMTSNGMTSNGTTSNGTTSNGTTSKTRRGIGFQAAGVLAVAVLSALSWFAWMGWDHQYQIVDGEPTGPYETWQVAGCAVTLLAVFVGALWLRVRAWAAAAALVLAFTIAWTVQASGEDESGMYAVGAIGLLVGLIAGTALVSAVVLPLRASWQAKHLPLGAAG